MVNINIIINYCHLLLLLYRHIISGFGPLFSLLIIQNMKSNNHISSNSILGSEYYIFNVFPLWPTISILIGILVNSIGNTIGIMPVD